MSAEERRRIPLADPYGDLRALRQGIMGALERVVDSNRYILGDEVSSFEKRIADRLGVPGAVGVGSGTDALVLGLLAVGVRPGDEVITASHTAGATVAAIAMVGGVAVLVEVDPTSYCLDPDALAGAISPLTKAILPVHLYGHPADLGKICFFAREHGIMVVEDCAQAQEAMLEGRPVGTIGDVGCFSFYPTKNLGAIGDGGMVVARREDVIERLRRLRMYGWSTPQFSQEGGGRCSRLDELQAAVLNVKLDGLAANIERRRALANKYNAAFADLPLVLPAEAPGVRHAYHLYVIRCDRRELLARSLDRAGISTGVHYPFPVHAQPGLRVGARIPRPLGLTESMAREILSLPLYASMSDHDQDRVITEVRSFFGA